MPRARVNGIELHYEVHGQGRPLVLTHGFAGAASFWAPQVAALAERYRVVVYDARGHAASDAPDDPAAYDELVYVEDLRQLLAHLGLGRACVGGLSMGGNIALRFGLAHPELVDGLVVCDAGTGSDDAAAWQKRCASLARLLEGRGLETFANVVLASPAAERYAARGPEQAAHYRALITGHRPEVLARVVRWEQATRPSLYSLEAELRSFDRPVLVLVGEHDQPSLAVSRFLAATLPRAELFVQPDSGHLTSLEDPAAFNAALAAFLARLWPA